MGVRPASVCSDLLKPGGYGRLAPMLKALTAAASDVGATDLDGFCAERLAAAREAGHRDTAAEHLAFVLGKGKAKYELAGNAKLPRSVDHDLEMWGCVACNFCVTVCPNDAFFKLPTPKPEADPAGLFAAIEGRQQYLVFSELCNECGNCLTFCPENGDPAVIKPRLFLDAERFDAASGERFLLTSSGQVEATAGGGAESTVPTLVALLNAAEGLPLRLE
jgi:putative selenate reductase